MTTSEFCPQCGRAREGRFCRGCGLDLDAPVPAGPPPAAPTTSAWAQPAPNPVASGWAQQAPTPAGPGWVQQAPAKPVNVGRRAKWSAALLVITGLFGLWYANATQQVSDILDRVSASM